jgi:N-acetylglucosaminyl-diphospho-decaprenol L-rhamnosyltransferase
MSTAVFVSFASPALDLDWIPDDADVVVVHNDASLDRASIGRAGVVHVDAGSNVGFGAAVNLALPHVTTARVVLCNPDIVLTAQHWDALSNAAADDVLTIPLLDEQQLPTSVTSRYPTPVSHLASGYRLGRFAPRGGWTRTTATRVLGSWGRAHEESLRTPVGTWPLAERWVSGAVFSVDTARLREVGGFDERYFLYYEDVDLCCRLARRYPTARAVVADVPPGVHRVGGSAPEQADSRAAVERIRRRSAVTYAHDQNGWSWRLCEHLLQLGSGRGS